MQRWNSSATIAITMLAVTPAASPAQTSTTFMSSNPNWTSATGCHITQGLLVLPGGVVYYTANTYPAAGAAMLGICGSFDDDVPPPTIGWSNQTVFPDFGTGGGGGGTVFQFTPQNDQGPNDQGDDDQGNSNDQGSNDQPHYQPTNDPPNTSENPQTAAPVTTSTPEPSSVILLGSGLAALAVCESRRRKRTTSSEE